MKTFLQSSFLIYQTLAMLSFAVLRWGFGFDGVFGQDAFEYARYASAWLNFMREGIDPGDYFWPMIYPLLGAVLAYITFLPISFCLQFLSTFSLGTIAYLLHRRVEAKRPQVISETVVYAIVILATFLSPYMFRAGMIVMTDMLAALFVLLTFTCYDWWLKTSKNSFITLMLFSAALATMTRYGSFILIVFPFIFSIKRLQKEHIRYYLLGFTLGLIVCIPHFYVRWNNSDAFLQHSALHDWSFLHFFNIPEHSFQGLLGLRLPNIIIVLSPFVHPGFFMLGIVSLGSLFYSKIDKKYRVYWIAILVYLLFIAGFDNKELPMNMRYFIICQPLILSAMLSKIFLLPQNILKRGILLLPVILLSSFVLTISTIRKNVLIGSIEKEIADHIQRLNPSGTVYSYGMDVSLNYRLPAYQFQTLFKNEAVQPDKNDYLLCQDNWLTGRLKDLEPGAVYRRLLEEDRLILDEELTGGWLLYRIE